MIVLDCVVFRVRNSEDCEKRWYLSLIQEHPEAKLRFSLLPVVSTPPGTYLYAMYVVVSTPGTYLYAMVVLLEELVGCHIQYVKGVYPNFNNTLYLIQNQIR